MDVSVNHFKDFTKPYVFVRRQCDVAIFLRLITKK